MSDPLSITASIVGITVPALHGTKILLEDLQGLKDAPRTVKRLTDDVQLVHAALGLLKSVEDRDWMSLGKGVAEQSEATIRSCTKACDLFRIDLQRWTRHSDDGKLAWQDRAAVGFFKKDQVRAMSEQLQSCNLAINLIVGVANLYGSVRNNQITDDIKKTIEKNQTEVKDAMTTAERQLVVLDSKMEEMNLSDEDDEAAVPAEGKAEALKRLEEERKALDASRKLLNELLAKAQEDAVAKATRSRSGSTTVTFGNNNSGFQAGTITGGVSGLTFGGK